MTVRLDELDDHSVEIASLDAPSDAWVAQGPVKVHALGPGRGSFGYAARFVPFGSNHVEPAQFTDFFCFLGIRRIPAKNNVHAAARNISGKGNAAHAAGLGDNFAFPFVVLGVQHMVLDAAPVQLAPAAPAAAAPAADND